MAKRRPMEAEYLSVPEAARLSGLSEDLIHRLLKEGKVRRLRPTAGRVLVSRDELRTYIESCAEVSVYEDEVAATGTHDASETES